MELYQEMLWQLCQEQLAHSQLDVSKIMESKCYQALRQIRDILRDERLNDRECCQKIEEIVLVFEALGSGGGGRHDFG